MQPPLFPPRRAPALRDDDRVRVAYALRGDRVVFAGDLAHLARRKDRPRFGCLGCEVPVFIVLPTRTSGVKKAPHFRHVRRSPGCRASSDEAARHWNARGHLHRALRSAPGAPLSIRRTCSPTANPWDVRPTLFDGDACDAASVHRLSAWETVRFDRSAGPGRADLLLLDATGATVLGILVRDVHDTAPVTHEGPWIALDLGHSRYDDLFDWDPRTDPCLPFTTASPDLAWRCGRHRRSRG